MPQESRERRGKFARLDVKSLATFRGINKPSVHHKCLCINISAHGARFLIRDLDPSLELGDEVEINFNLPGGLTEIKAVASVRWIKREFDAEQLPRQYQVGLEFVHIDPKNTELIRNVIFENVQRRR